MPAEAADRGVGIFSWPAGLSASEDTNYLSDGSTFGEYLAKIGPRRIPGGVFYVRAAGYPVRGVYVRAGRIPVRSPCSGVDPLFRRGRSHLRTGRCRFRTGRSHPPDARPPIFARSALRKGPDAPFSDSFCPFLQRPAAPEPTPFANPRFRRSGKAKKLFFYFYFIIKDVSLCSQNNT